MFKKFVHMFYARNFTTIFGKKIYYMCEPSYGALYL